MKKRSNLAALFGSVPEGNNAQWQSYWRFLRGVMFPFGSVLIAAVALLVKGEQLPGLAIYVVVPYLIVTVVLLLVPLVIQANAALRAGQRKKRLVERFYPRLRESAKEFALLIEQGNSNTLLYFFADTSNWLTRIGIDSSRIDKEHIQTIKSWFESLRTRLQSPKYLDFFPLASEMSSLINSHNRFCIKAQEYLQANVVAQKFPESEMKGFRQQWNLCREKYAFFIQNWERLAKNINDDSGERICLDYYEPLKTLE
jgi:hypothetical protein